MTIYERIKKRRRDLGLSAQTLANALNVSRATIYRYESAYIEKLPLSTLEPLSKALNVTPAYLMGWEEHPNILTHKEVTELTEIHNQLNSKGQEKLIDYGKDLLINPAYTKDGSTN